MYSLYTHIYLVKIKAVKLGYQHLVISEQKSQIVLFTSLQKSTEEPPEKFLVEPESEARPLDSEGSLTDLSR